MSSGKLTQRIWKIPSKIVSTCNNCMLTSLKSWGFDNLPSKVKEQVPHFFKNALIVLLLELMDLLPLISISEDFLFLFYSLCQPEGNVMNKVRMTKGATSQLQIHSALEPTSLGSSAILYCFSRTGHTPFQATFKQCHIHIYCLRVSQVEIQRTANELICKP